MKSIGIIERIKNMKVMIYGHSLFSIDMLWGAKQLGHDASLINPKSVQELERILVTAEPDLLMTLGSPAYFHTDILQYIGSRKTPHMKYIHWDTDGITWMELEMNHIRLSQPDKVFTVCPQMFEKLKKEKIPSDMLLFGVNSEIHHPGGEVDAYKGLITFAGGAYPEVVYRVPKHHRRLSMEVLFEPLLKQGYEIDFFGDFRHKQVIKSLFGHDISNERIHGRCPYERIHEIYSNCFINLVVQNSEYATMKRTFEILGSGGFIMAYPNATLGELFSIGKDLVVSRTPEETLELVEYYKNNLDKYDEIRKNALKAVEEHTYKKRFEYITNQLV